VPSVHANVPSVVRSLKPIQTLPEVSPPSWIVLRTVAFSAALVIETRCPPREMASASASMNVRAVETTVYVVVSARRAAAYGASDAAVTGMTAGTAMAGEPAAGRAGARPDGAERTSAGVATTASAASAAARVRRTERAREDV